LNVLQHRVLNKAVLLELAREAKAHR